MHSPGHVLVAANGSHVGGHALDVARQVADAARVVLSIVTVTHDGQGVPDRLIPFAPIVAHGVPGIEIVRTSEAVRADLVVLGRTVYPTASGPQLGPTADAVVRRLRVPCLLVPPDFEGVQRMVVALDGTDRGFAVHDAARSMQRLLGVPVTFVTVEPAGEGAVLESQVRAQTLRTVAALDRWATAHRQAKVPLRVLRGDPETLLAEEIRDPRADVLVVGIRRGGPGGAASRSGVGRRLLLSAPSAVMTIPI